MTPTVDLEVLFLHLRLVEASGGKQFLEGLNLLGLSFFFVIRLGVDVHSFGEDLAQG